jgi:hypothetical protein
MVQLDKHCTTSRKVAGSIPDGPIDIFYLFNPSGRSVAVGATQPLILNEYQGYLLGCTVGRCLGLTTLQYSPAYLLGIQGAKPLGAVRECPGLYKE